jgi:adenylate cyclase
MTGSFHKPQEEYRIFMFLDLEGSTEIAEKLGHLKYSRFIQDCFYDLSVFETSNAEVYQYVGDEAVLTWKVKTDKKLVNKINGYFLFKERLLSKQDYYNSSYCITPVFKASMHLGPVTAVEVGSLKREIAYHGDTLNITSRLQKQCKIFNQDFLVSGSIVNAIEKSQIFTFNKIEEQVLKGKKETTTIYSVEKRK